MTTATLGLAVAASIACAAPALSETKPTLSSQSVFSIVDCSNASIVLRFTADPAPLALRTLDITATQQAADVPTPPIAWTIVWDAPSPSDPAIHEHQAVGTLKNGCPLPGRYDVPLAVLQPQSGQLTAESLRITVERGVDPILDAPAAAALTLETWPLRLGAAGDLPGLGLGEISGGAALGQVFAAGTTLKSSAGDLIPIQLTAPQPVMLAAGQSSRLGLALSNTPDPGTYTGRLLLHGLGVKQSQPVEITLKVRVIWWFLLVTIGLGVLAGWAVNVYLAQRAALGAAQLQGLRDVAAIAARAMPQKDAVVQQRLLSLAAVVEAKVRNASTPTEIQDDIADGKTKAAEIETGAAKTAKDLADGIVRLRAQLAPDGLPLDDMVADRLASLTQELNAIERVGATGNVESALADIGDLETRVKAEVAKRLRAWLADVNDALTQQGPWAEPALEPELTRSKLLVDVATAYGQNEAGAAVRQSNEIAQRLRRWTIFGAPSGAMRIFRRAVAALRTGGRDDLADALANRADDAMRPAAPDPIATIESITGVRRDVEELLRRARPNDAALDHELESGDFEAAAKRVAPPPAAAPKPAAELPSMVIRAFLPPLARPGAALPAAAPSLTPPRIILPPHLVIGQTAQAKLDWSRATLPTTAATWSCQPQTYATLGRHDEQSTDLTGVLAGFCTIVADFQGSLSATANTYIGEAIDAPNYQQIAANTRRVNGAIAVATAILTVFFGYEIFIGSWFGTFADFFSAFLWGFFGQFGLERLRDLAKPITSKALP